MYTFQWFAHENMPRRTPSVLGQPLVGSVIRLSVNLSVLSVRNEVFVRLRTKSTVSYHTECTRTY